MRVIKDYCDHCGKELDCKTDYCETEIEAKTVFRADLCDKCITELDKIVREFCDRKGGE